MNIRDPAMAATPKQAQGTGSTSPATSVTGRLFQETRRRRRSRMAIDPTTRAMAITWTVSAAGNIQVDWAIARAGAVASIHVAMETIDIPQAPRVQAIR